MACRSSDNHRQRAVPPPTTLRLQKYCVKLQHDTALFEVAPHFFVSCAICARRLLLKIFASLTLISSLGSAEALLDRCSRHPPLPSSPLLLLKVRVCFGVVLLSGCRCRCGGEFNTSLASKKEGTILFGDLLTRTPPSHPAMAHACSCTARA